MSGLFNRLLRREGTSKLEWTSTTNKNAPPTFVPELIRNKTWISSDLDHLAKVAEKDPVASFIVYEISEMVFDDWFRFVDADGNEVLEEALQQLRLLNAKKAFTQVLAAERTFGYAWLYTGKNRYIPQEREGGRIASLQFFTPQSCSVFEYDDNGNPKMMKVELTVGRGSSQFGEVLYLPASDFILWCTRPIGRGYTGRSALEPVWDMLTYIRYLFHSMTFFDIKIGHGLFTAFTKGGMSDDVLDKWQAAFEDISIKRAMVIDAGQIDSLQFIGPTSQPTDFDAHIDACLAMVAVGTRIPKDLLVGAAAGAVTGSETNLKLAANVERQIKTSIEEYIWEVISRMGFTNNGYFIEWLTKYPQDEEEQAKIEMNKAQTLAIRSQWMTVNEIREIEGLPPRAEGDKLKSDFEIGFQTPDEAEKTRNPEGAQL